MRLTIRKSDIEIDIEATQEDIEHTDIGPMPVEPTTFREPLAQLIIDVAGPMLCKLGLNDEHMYSVDIEGGQVTKLSELPKGKDLTDTLRKAGH